MGVTISHGTNDGRMHRSYGHLADLGKHLAHVLPGRDWAQIADLFDGRFADVTEIGHRQAGRIADILDRAARHRKIPRDWANEATTFAACARRAARARQPWTWS
ncbi:hypothetical protein [Streptomyces sp. DH37]|uniref:DUF7739 domain-containing protein n=1 Tax=Streptomyces sp. DH37 TaxID=3040122 RepID=UPI0024420759|nr:hypothetical protein [Streptomyces sp. DH37]MDG9701684.1 hypothetical protein [Streptomyces sp. DH37]